ncbi:MAG: DUF4129 domain-containing protein [Pyrinomonadaceae bacterium]
MLGERVEADETAADLFAEAEALARNGETRAAIRKAYIALLCELGDRKILRLEQHKTNRDYLQALLAKPALYAEVQPLTKNYETSWYGRDAECAKRLGRFPQAVPTGIRSGSAEVTMRPRIALIATIATLLGLLILLNAAS